MSLYLHCLVQGLTSQLLCPQFNNQTLWSTRLLFLGTIPCPIIVKRNLPAAVIAASRLCCNPELWLLRLNASREIFSASTKATLFSASLCNAVYIEGLYTILYSLHLFLMNQNTQMSSTYLNEAIYKFLFTIIGDNGDLIVRPLYYCHIRNWKYPLCSSLLLSLRTSVLLSYKGI